MTPPPKSPPSRRLQPEPLKSWIVFFCTRPQPPSGCCDEVPRPSNKKLASALFCVYVWHTPNGCRLSLHHRPCCTCMFHLTRSPSQLRSPHPCTYGMVFLLWGLWEVLEVPPSPLFHPCPLDRLLRRTWLGAYCHIGEHSFCPSDFSFQVLPEATAPRTGCESAKRPSALVRSVSPLPPRTASVMNPIPAEQGRLVGHNVGDR